MGIVHEYAVVLLALPRGKKLPADRGALLTQGAGVRHVGPNVGDTSCAYWPRPHSCVVRTSHPESSSGLPTTPAKRQSSIRARHGTHGKHRARRRGYHVRVNQARETHEPVHPSAEIVVNHLARHASNRGI